MAAGIIMAKVDAANQASQILAMSGKTFTVGKVAGTGNGVANLLTFTPTGGQAGGTVALKLEGTRQMVDLAAMSGKTVTVGKPAMMAGGTNNWLAIQPVTVGATKASAASTASLIKLEGARQGLTAASLTGQKVTVVQPMLAGKGAGSTLFLQPAGGGKLVALNMANNSTTTASLVGKSFTVGKAPLVAGKVGGSSWLVLKPAVATKTIVTGTVVAAAPTVQAKTVAMTTTTPPKIAASSTGIAKSSAVVKGGTIWKGTGAGLGLGLGLGVWGPIILAGVSAAAVYGYVRSRKDSESTST